MKKLKVLTVVGTRPEIIRLSRVMARLDEHCEHVMVHTGQNYDYELNEVFFQDLELRLRGPGLRRTRRGDIVFGRAGGSAFYGKLRDNPC